MQLNHSIHTRLKIRGSAEQVWTVLMNFELYPHWNPFITQVRGQAVPGQKLSVKVLPVGGKPMSFKPTVTVAQAHRELRWVGHLLFKGLFDGEHCFKLEPADDGTVLVHGETFNGLLVPLLRKMLQQQTYPGFLAMNEALRQQVEQGRRELA